MKRKSELARARKALRRARKCKNEYRIEIIENHIAAVAAGKTPQPTAARAVNKKMGRAANKKVEQAGSDA